MRGARFISHDSSSPQRIIPADAGSTGRRTRSGSLRRDHPRRCGEHQSQAARKGRGKGSSPQMRGAHGPIGSYPIRFRIIPADAGSTLARRFPDSQSRDHPRRCGEHVRLSGRSGSGRGSSPQMRGAPCLLVGLSPSRRIIPADAGSTIAYTCFRDTTQDHPRRCGEHSLASLSFFLTSGSSPQMRGAPWM